MPVIGKKNKYFTFLYLNGLVYRKSGNKKAYQSLIGF
jgi:hypothetical protein